MESTFARIQRKTGTKISFCKCQQCKTQCIRQPGMGTPEDMQRLIDAGYADQLALTDWGAGILMGVTKEIVTVVAPLYDTERKCCTFLKDGLCELHDKGLKPTECKLAHHTTGPTNFIAKKSIAWHVIQEWRGVDAENFLPK